MRLDYLTIYFDSNQTIDHLPDTTLPRVQSSLPSMTDRPLGKKYLSTPYMTRTNQD
jgi:hypothetical protein